MSKSSAIYVGMDVHKDSIDIALAAAGARDEVRHYGTVGGGLAEVDRALRKIVGEGRTLHVVYEAGPCGYTLYRHLSARGIDCTVVAPSRIPKRPGDRIKTDRRDAEMLARLHRAGELEAVYVPRPEDEAVRDLTRAREDAKGAQTRARHQLKAVPAEERRRLCRQERLDAGPRALAGFGEAAATGAAARVPGIRRGRHDRPGTHGAAGARFGRSRCGPAALSGGAGA